MELFWKDGYVMQGWAPDHVPCTGGRVRAGLWGPDGLADAAMT
jgi:hypothetical protein